ncbi:kelch-like protein 23 [Gigaspora margarita]|uniref:Kelch-like protein 23 n=1 Tax=Gigaspora margarita TaxID=4874 RepID=A0A8H3XLC6_GIGMA|nr:kelch-like protein 23 [Gigaspora margarita]
MGLRASNKRVVLPMYKATDHTPSVYHDRFSDRLIPVGYFLNNLDEIGPAHWNNPETADYTLKIIKPQEVDYFCNYFNQICESNNIINRNLYSLNCIVRGNRIQNNQNNQNISNQNECQTLENFEWQEHLPNCQQNLPVICSDKFCSAADAAALSLYFNAALMNYQQLMNNFQRYDNNISGIPSPPSSPIVDSHQSINSTNISSTTNISSNISSNNNSIQKLSPPPDSPPDYYFHIHILILATQSGFFNQLFGPINVHSSSSQLPSTIFVPIPYPECFGTILHWLYHHDDDAWLDEITEENFEKFYWNIRFLKLGKEAYDVLDEWLDECLEDGLNLNCFDNTEIIQDW